MSNIRKAHSVEIIDRRLRNCEASGSCDAMELVGLHDELARVERKWTEKAQQFKDGRKPVRPLSDAGQLNARFDRLTRLIEAALRRPDRDSPERELLRLAALTLQARTPLKQ